MAKKKTEEIKEVKEAKDAKGKLRGIPDTDFTYYDKPLMGYLRLNKSCIIGILVDYDAGTVSGVVWDELDNVTGTFSAELE